MLFFKVTVILYCYYYVFFLNQAKDPAVQGREAETGTKVESRSPANTRTTGREREGIRLGAKKETRDPLKLMLEHTLELADLGVNDSMWTFNYLE